MFEATTNTIPSSSSSNRTPLLVAAWLAAGIAIAFTGFLSHVPQFAPAYIIASAVGWTLAYRRREDIRAWADRLPLRMLVAGHAARLPIGALFLWEESHGRLSPLFAHGAGWGDMAIGAAAIAVALFAWKRRSVVRLFAVVGLVDILMAVGTTIYLLFIVHDPLMMSAIARLPYPLLPLMVVPLVVITHLLMIARTRRGQS